MLVERKVYRRGGSGIGAFYEEGERYSAAVFATASG